MALVIVKQLTTKLSVRVVFFMAAPVILDYLCWKPILAEPRVKAMGGALK
jgi:hypothetical protein